MCFRLFGPSATVRAVILGPVLLLSLFAGGSSRQAASGPNALANVEVLIIRHAERNGAEDELTLGGVERANAYPAYFKTLTIDGRPIHLTHLFAEKSKRTRTTLEPLAKAMNMPLDTRYATKESPALVEDLKEHSYGNEVLICWHHSKMPKLIKELGGNPAALLPDGEWPDSTFDWIIDLRYDSTGHLSASSQKCVHEHLMPGDSK